jgi:transcriptional regulator with XRE-family HTH domain
MGSPIRWLFPLPKTIHTERHRHLRESLIAERKAAGLTQTVVAQRLGKPPSYVAKYEGGDRRLDVLEYLDVAAAVGFDPCGPIQSLLDDQIKRMRPNP